MTPSRIKKRSPSLLQFGPEFSKIDGSFLSVYNEHRIKDFRNPTLPSLASGYESDGNIASFRYLMINRKQQQEVYL